MNNRKLNGEGNVSDEWRTNTQVKGNRGEGEYDIKATRVVNRAQTTNSVSGLKDNVRFDVDDESIK